MLAQSMRKDIRGFTLVEVIVASVVLSMLVYFVYLLFSSFSRTQEVGHWSFNTTNRMRNGLTLLRTEIGRSSKPEVVTQKGSEPFDTGNGDKERFLYVPADMPFSTENVSGEQLILQFYMCRLGREGMPGQTAIAPEIMIGKLIINDRKLLYRRTILSQPADYPDKIPEMSQVIAEDISRVELSTREIDPAVGELSVKNRNFLVITIASKHPRYTNTTVVESIDAPFEVEVRRGGFP